MKEAVPLTKKFQANGARGSFWSILREYVAFRLCVVLQATPANSSFRLRNEKRVCVRSQMNTPTWEKEADATSPNNTSDSCAYLALVGKQYCQNHWASFQSLLFQQHRCWLRNHWQGRRWRCLNSASVSLCRQTQRRGVRLGNIHPCGAACDECEEKHRSYN